MQTGNTARSWGAIQQCLHWTVAFLVVCQVIIGLIMVLSPEHSVPNLGRFVHPTIGLLIGALVLLRLGWREANPVPALPADLSPRLQTLARATHYGFYLLLISMPVVGYLMINAHGGHVHFFHAVLPSLMDKAPEAAQLFWLLHLLGAMILIALIAAHVTGALQHEFVRRDNVLRRMLGFLLMTEDRQVRQDTPADSGSVRSG